MALRGWGCATVKVKLKHKWMVDKKRAEKPSQIVEVLELLSHSAESGPSLFSPPAGALWSFVRKLQQWKQVLGEKQTILFHFYYMKSFSLFSLVPVKHFQLSCSRFLKQKNWFLTLLRTFDLVHPQALCMNSHTNPVWEPSSEQRTDEEGCSVLTCVSPRISRFSMGKRCVEVKVYWGSFGKVVVIWFKKNKKI